jgi:hypothetical protein
MPISVRLGNAHAALLACRYRSRDETSFVAILLEPPEHRTKKRSRRCVALGVSTAIVPDNNYLLNADANNQFAATAKTRASSETALVS